MNSIFRPFLRKFVLVFLDDILVYSRSLKDHYTHLRIVLEVLQSEALFANHGKCVFGQGQINYLGDVMSADGVSAYPFKINAMLSLPSPWNIREL